MKKIPSLLARNHGTSNLVRDRGFPGCSGFSPAKGRHARVRSCVDRSLLHQQAEERIATRVILVLLFAEPDPRRPTSHRPRLKIGPDVTMGLEPFLCWCSSAQAMICSLVRLTLRLDAEARHGGRRVALQAIGLWAGRAAVPERVVHCLPGLAQRLRPFPAEAFGQIPVRSWWASTQPRIVSMVSLRMLPRFGLRVCRQGALQAKVATGKSAEAFA